MEYSTLLAHVKLGATNEGLLEISGEIVERFGAHAIGIAAYEPVSDGQLALVPEYTDLGAWDVIADSHRRMVEDMMAEAEYRFRTALGGRARSVKWRRAITSESRSDAIARQVRAADILVTTACFDGPPNDEYQRVSVGDIVLRAGRPVLLIPPETRHLNIDTVMVAWRDTREARRAIADALPFLKEAARVTIVGVAAAPDLPDTKTQLADVTSWLARHDVRAEPRVESFKGMGCNQLDAIAQEIGAGLLVAGAYGHSRFREWMIGGVTMDLLLHPKRPTLISH